MSLIPSSSWGLAFGVGCVLASSFDFYWFFRLAYTRITALFSKPLNVRDEATITSICSTTDIDYFFHMNNGRYFRELDFARFDFYFRSGLGAVLTKHPKSFVVQHAASIRYRRSLDFLMLYRIHTRLIWFDQRSFYFEQKFISIHDNFIRAVAICKNTAVNVDVIGAMKDNFDLNQPECPEDLAKFIESHDISSNKLKLTGHPVSVATNLSDLDKKSI